MSENPEDFLERTERISKNWCGEAMTPDQILSQFQLYGGQKRAEILDEIDTQLREMNPANLRRYAELVSTRRKMDEFHHAARKVGR